MKIIDAHLHFEQGGYWDVIAEEAGHVIQRHIWPVLIKNIM